MSIKVQCIRKSKKGENGRVGTPFGSFVTFDSQMRHFMYVLVYLMAFSQTH